MSEEKKDTALDVVETNETDPLCIVLGTPYQFEGKSYPVIDLTGLKNTRAANMIAVSRLLNRKGNADINAELSLEYAITLCAMMTQKPIEFFEQLPANIAMQVKGRVTGFFYSRV